MRLKLDENLGERGRRLLGEAGHEVRTVLDQRLSGMSDRALAEACAAESRCLVTLDPEFANPLAFPPAKFAGLAVLRPARRPTAADLEGCVHTLIAGLSREDIVGRLWIVEQHRIRRYEATDESPPPLQNPRA